MTADQYVKMITENVLALTRPVEPPARSLLVCATPGQARRVLDDVERYLKVLRFKYRRSQYVLQVGKNTLRAEGDHPKIAGYSAVVHWETPQ